MDEDNKELEGKSKRKSIKNGGLLLAASVFVITIISLTIYGCSISKKPEEKAHSNNKSNIVLEEKDKTSDKKENKEESNKNSDKNTSKSEESSSNSSKKDSQDSSSKNVEDENTSTSSGVSSEGSGSFREVKEPVLGDSRETTVLVSGKDSYLVDDISYTYSLSLIFPDEDKYSIVKYFCPKKTYDAVKSGDSLKVTYQLDSEGTLSITSVAK